MDSKKQSQHTKCDKNSFNIKCWVLECRWVAELVPARPSSLLARARLARTESFFFNFFVVNAEKIFVLSAVYLDKQHHFPGLDLPRILKKQIINSNNNFVLI